MFSTIEKWSESKGTFSNPGMLHIIPKEYMKKSGSAGVHGKGGGLGRVARKCLGSDGELLKQSLKSVPYFEDCDTSLFSHLIKEIICQTINYM